MDADLALVEGTPYHHEEYGRVLLLLVTNDFVAIESTEEAVAGIPKTYKQSETAFRAAAEPAPQSLSVPSNSMNSSALVPK